MLIKTSERGQALIIITLAAIGLFAFAALAIDGSMAFSEKRHAQNAADASALAGALAYARGNDIEAAALARAQSNGYENDASDPSTSVTVTVADVPDEEECPGDATGKDITVTIETYMDTTFSKIIGRDQIASGATATARACGFKYVPLFYGNAIVGLNPNTATCAFDSGNSGAARWEVEGGGIFSNGCAWSKNHSSVNLNGGCVTSVGNATGFTCQNSFQTSQAIPYPAGVDAIMPPNPCDGTDGDIGKPPPASGSTFSNGVYCISDMDKYDKKDIVLDNATLYVTDMDFQLKFAGGGGFYGYPTRRGTYPGSDDFDNYYMVIARNPTPCPRFTDKNTQVIEWRGNGGGTFYGTVLAPSACLDIRGNGDPAGMHTQIIGYNVGSNGTADVYIKYNEEENHRIPVSPSISLLE